MGLKNELVGVYQIADPWNYRRANRHAITAGVCQQHWHGGSVLEYGCGEGVLMDKLEEFLSPSPENMIGSDLVPVALARARSRWGTMCPMFLEHDVRRTLPPLRADLVLISDVLPYIADEARRVIREAWGQVLPKGQLVLTSWLNGHDLGDCFDGATGLPDGEVVMRLEWEGVAVDAEGQRHMAQARYLVIQRK